MTLAQTWCQYQKTFAIINVLHELNLFEMTFTMLLNKLTTLHIP